MRILHVYKTYYPDTLGGIQLVIAQLCRASSSLGDSARVFTLSPHPIPQVIVRPEGEVHRSARVVEVASNPLSFSALSDFPGQVRWADVIHYHFPWPFADLLHLAFARSKPSVVTYHSDVVRQTLLRGIYWPLMQRFLTQVGRVVATSPQYLATSSVLRSLPISPQMIPNGVDEHSYPQPTQEHLLRWRERLGEGFLLFVGSLRYYKGLEVLLDAAVGLRGRIVIAGEGQKEASLRAKISKLRLGHVYLLGRVSEEEKVALTHLSGGFVFPSQMRSEAFGMALVEAAMLGKPLITCEIGSGTSYVNQHGESGWVVPPANPEALHAAMQALLDQPSVAERLGRGARARFQRLFTAQAMAGAYRNLYESVRGGGSAPLFHAETVLNSGGESR
jgi:rhamnosyl/mannosyltransferase